MLPWQGNTLVGTTEVRQALEEKIECSQEEKTYLLSALALYFPSIQPNIVGTFAGLRPLLRSDQDPSKAHENTPFTGLVISYQFWAANGPRQWHSPTKLPTPFIEDI